MMNNNVYAFTTRSHGGLLRELKTEVEILNHVLGRDLRNRGMDANEFVRYMREEHKNFKGSAVWDTGATNTVIDKRVVQKCELKPIGQTRVRTASREEICNVYSVDVVLPNKVIMEGIVAVKNNLGDEYDVLIGMDIIGMGDFAVTNHGGRTTFTFRYPSQGEIDFVGSQQVKT